MTVGGDWGNPPFEYLDEAGKAAGFAVDLVSRIAETVGLDAIFELSSPAEARARFDRGGIDALGGMFLDPADEKSTVLSMPYFSMNYSAFAPKDSTIRGPSDIMDKRIAVRRGDIGYEYLENKGMGATLVVVDSMGALFSALLRGDADCAVMPLLLGSQLARNKAFSTFRPAGPPLFRAEYRLVAREEDRDMLAMLDEGLSTIRANGDYELIYRRWFRDYESPGTDSRILGIMEAMVAVAMTLGGLAALWAAATRKRNRQLKASLALESRRNAEAQDRLHAALTESEAARLESMGSQARGTAASALPATSCAEEVGTLGRGKCNRAIVAEDEAINRLYIRRVLEAAGMEVRQAIDGQKALDAASDGPWSFILMDVSMPRMDGLEATRLIRAQEAERGTAHIPIIALTAHSNAEDREACAQAGMDGFLSKPFSEQALWAEVNRTTATLAGA